MIKPGLDNLRYCITPGNEAIAVIDEGLEFYSFSGQFLTSYNIESLGTSPLAVTFLTSQKAFFWAAYNNGYRGGGLFRVKLDIQGREEFKADFAWPEEQGE